MIKTVSVNKVLVAASAYDAEDVLSESTSAGTSWVFQRCGGSGSIIKAHLRCKTTNVTPRMTLYLFRRLPTSNLNDHAANTAVLNADKANSLGKIDFPALEDVGGVSEAVATPSTYGNVPLSFRTETETDTIWGILAIRDAATITAGDDITIDLDLEP